MRVGLSSFLQWRLNILMYRALGWKITFSYLNMLGKVYFFINRKEKRLVKRGIESVFSDQREPGEVRGIRRDVFRGIIRHYYEKLFNAYSSADELETYFERNIVNGDMKAILKGLARGKGVLLVTGHFGGVEFIPGFLAYKELPVSIVARFSSAHLRESSLQKAKKFSARIIDADCSPNIVREILDQLRSNRIVITQCDEIDEWRPSRNNCMSFLSKEIQLDKTIPALMKRAGASVVFGIIHRGAEDQYEFISNSWEDMAKGVAYKSSLMGAVVLKWFERYIYQYPEEWYQWKKFAGIESVPPGRTGGSVPATALLLKPSFREAA